MNCCLYGTEFLKYYYSEGIRVSERINSKLHIIYLITFCCIGGDVVSLVRYKLNI
jgi:hypothetical protein